MLHLDPLMVTLVSAAFLVLILGLVMRMLGQPPVVAYLLTGVLLGPSGLRVFTDEAQLSRVGAFGVTFLLFFAGLEMSPRSLLERWRVAIGGTLAQVLVSVGVVALVGIWRDWPLPRTVLLGFVISLSSTAVVLGYLSERGGLVGKTGRDVLAVLLAQDVAIVPMLVFVGILGGGRLDSGTLVLQAIGAAIILALVVWLAVAPKVHLPLGRRLRGDHELQVFAALVICFGLALMTAVFQLSAALGAFVGGMVVGAAREAEWIRNRLEPFRVVFVALFLVSVGLLVDLSFFFAHLPAVVALSLAVFATNTGVNAMIFRWLGDPWPTSLYAGSLLSQIGELSFVLAAVGQQTELITEFAYQITVSVIAVTLIFSPVWIRGIDRLTQGIDRRGETSNGSATS